MASPEREQHAGARQAYVKPQLKAFGRIAELTTALDNMGPADGGTVMGFRET